MLHKQKDLTYQQLVEKLKKHLPDEKTRLNYDYSIPGFYAVTINAFDFRWFFGKVLGDEMHLNERGRIAQRVWQDLPKQFPYVHLHEYIFMPNHMHGIIELMEPPLQKDRIPLWKVIRRFKAKTTYEIRHSPGRPWFAWENGSWQSVLPSEKALYYMRRYIINNPANWRDDKLYKKSLKGGQYT